MAFSKGRVRIVAQTRWLPEVRGFRTQHVCLATLLTLTVSLMIPTYCVAQKTATLTGTVQDESGAVVSGAKIVLTDEASKAERTTVSNGEGYFTFSAVQTAIYDVEVQAKGFESWRVTAFEVDPGDQRSVPNIRLKVGVITEVVTIAADRLGVNTTSGERSDLITSEDIKRLSTVGRDVSELIKFLPGFAINPGGSIQNGAVDTSLVGFGSTALPGYAANGAAPQSGNATVVSDGVSVVDPGDMGASITNVNMDMVQEVKVETSNFSADSAKGPIVINAVGKSGGSAYHGSAYLYARDHALDSNDWLSNYFQEAKPMDHYYYPGGNIGGPVWIPGTDFNHDKKLTFWTGFEYYDQTNVNGNLTGFVPNAAMLGGDLSLQTIATALNVTPALLTSQCVNSYTFGTLSDVLGICYSPSSGSNGTNLAYTPMNGLLIPGSGPSQGMIPSSEIETAAVKAYSQFYPKPNRIPQPVPGTPGAPTDGINYVDNLLATHNGFQYHGRVDENISDNTKVYTNVNWEQINDEIPAQNIYYFPSDTIPYPTPAYSNINAVDVSVNFTHIFNPTLTNEFIAAGVHFYQPNQLQNPGLVSDAKTGFPFRDGPYTSNGQTQLPAIIDYTLGVPSFSMSDFPNYGVYFRKYSWNISDNVNKQFRTHSMKFGGYLETTANNQVQLGNYAQGEYVFAPYEGCITPHQTNPPSYDYSNIGNAIGNFLVGCSQSFNQNSSDPPADMHFRTVAFYATDEWKATRRLTLTYGVRFDHLGPWLDNHGVGLAIWQPTPGMYNVNINPNDPTTWPGISWHQLNKSIPLGGRTVPWSFVSPRLGIAYDVFGDGKTVVRGGWGSYRYQSSYNDYAGPLITTLGVGSYSAPQNCTYEQLQGTGSVPGNTSCIASGASPIPAAFSIYAIDPHDHEQPVTYNYNLTIDRQLPRDTFFEIAYVGNSSTALPTEGTLSNQNAIPRGGLFQPDPCPSNCVGTPGAVYLPGTTVNGLSTIQDFRPYRNYQSVYVSNHVGYADYNGLQASVKRQKGGFIYNVNYTFSKALGVRSDYRTGFPSDPTRISNNYGAVGFDRSQILNLVYSYQEGKRFHGSKLLQTVANGWEISGITGFQSGPDLSVLANGGTNFGLGGGLSWTSGTEAFGMPINNENLLGTPDISLQPAVKCSPTSNLATKQYANGSCFGLPALGQNGPYDLPYIHGPAYFNTDLSLYKDFRIGEKGNLQFRGSGFNFLNHPINSFYGGSSAGYSLVFSDPPNNTFNTEQQALAGATAAPYFGYTPYRVGRRVVELGVKYEF